MTYFLWYDLLLVVPMLAIILVCCSTRRNKTY